MNTLSEGVLEVVLHFVTGQTILDTYLRYMYYVGTGSQTRVTTL